MNEGLPLSPRDGEKTLSKKFLTGRHVFAAAAMAALTACNEHKGPMVKMGETDTRIESCYEGPAVNINVGECRAGVRHIIDGKRGICVGQVLPTTEICDGKDNDCDGNVDYKAVDTNLTCDTRKPGDCASGLTACSNGVLSCKPKYAGCE